MAQHYSDPTRAEDPHALPDVEVFYLSKADARANASTVCPNCGQWQHASTGDCLHECKRRGFAQ